MIYFIIGNKGSGKSLFLVIIAYFIIVTKKVISNLTIHFPNIEKFEIDMLLNEYLKEKDMLIDEAYLYADCRKSMSSDNILFAQFDYQSRKNKNNVYFATQKIRSIDFRITDFIDFLVECNHKDASEDPFIYTITEIHEGKRGSSSTLVIPYKLAQEFFKYFDTYEVIQSDTSEMMKNQKLSKERIQEIVDTNITALDLFAKEYKRGTITDEFIQFFLEEHSLPYSKKIILAFKFEASKRGLCKNVKK